jgi:TonB-linked SusC/RagA family outer membrane protein
MRRLLLSTMVLLFAISGAIAQDRTVSGRILAEDGSPIPGVNVVLKGTAIGTASDADGRYALSVPASGGTLVFSFIGYRVQEVPIGERTAIDVSLILDATQLSEVVITGQNITQSRKALGYAISVVGENQIASRPVNDISRVLQGKIPGVVIAPTGGTSGAGASINIRGYSSLTGSTQPLWVVDGVPFNTDTNAGSGFTTGGQATATSRFLDIDPNTIQSINVLKGLAATVLYGDQGRNGVILVTTKSGAAKKKQAEITFQQTLSVTEIASWPTLQNNYGNGFQGLFGNFFSNWGPNFNQVDSVGHPYQFANDASLREAFPEFYFKRIPYAAAPDPKGFFRKGVVSNTSIGISGGTDKLGYNASIAYTSEEGYAPGNELKRLNLSTGFNAAVTDKFSIRTSLIFANTEFETPPLNGATGGSVSFGGVPSLYANFLYTPRNWDILSFPYETPLEKKSVWYRASNDIPNPNWMAKYHREASITNRVFVSSTFAYDFTDNLALSYRVGLDSYTETQNREFNKGIGPSYANIDRGVFQTQAINNTIWNHDMIISLAKPLSSDINLNARIGGNARNDYRQRDGIYSETQTVFGLMRHSNFEGSSSRSIAFDNRVFYRTDEIQRYGAYADFSFDYKDYLFLNLAGRKDWISTLESGNNSIFYPSVSASFLPTEVFTSLKSSTLNALKIRAGFGTSAGFPPTYRTRDVVNQNLRAFSSPTGVLLGEHTIANQLGNRNLLPELQKELEAGFEAKMFNNRLGIDFTVFDRSTRDLITSAPIDPSTGFTSTFVNLGKISNKGIEIGLTGTPLQLSNGLRWDAIINYTLVRPEVIDLGGDIEEVALSGFTDQGNFAIPGQPFNIMKGSVRQRDTQGNPIVGADGLYIRSPILGIVGNPNPDYFVTFINTFSWKGFEFMFQFDYRHGGDIFSSTANAVLGRGTGAAQDYNQDLTLILPGVKNIGTAESPNYVKNDIMISASDYGFNTLYGAGATTEVGIFDGTTIRLREIALSYTLPRSILSKTPIKNASIQINGNNLWFNAVNVPKVVNFDSEISSLGVDNGAGFDYLTGPSVRRYGAVLRLTF